MNRSDFYPDLERKVCTQHYLYTYQKLNAMNHQCYISIMIFDRGRSKIYQTIKYSVKKVSNDPVLKKNQIEILSTTQISFLVKGYKCNTLTTLGFSGDLVALWPPFDHKNLSIQCFLHKLPLDFCHLVDLSISDKYSNSRCEYGIGTRNNSFLSIPHTAIPQKI